MKPRWVISGREWPSSARAGAALYDLILRPYHSYKTEHGLAKTSRQSVSALATRATTVRANLL
jgi:glycosyltransferase XagB